MQLPRISFVLYFMAIISLITLSNDILLLVNYPYADPTSSSVYKLHPVLYFSFISILFLIFFKRNIAIKELFFNKKFFYLYLIDFTSAVSSCCDDMALPYIFTFSLFSM
jgi:hypothetical protein